MTLPLETITDQRLLEWRLLYSAIIAGKSASFAEGAMERLGNLLGGWRHPFDAIRIHVKLGNLPEMLELARTGNYSKLTKCFSEIVTASNLDLPNCTPSQLEKFHGIGPKTSRFFIIWNRPNERLAALDVHVLRWLRQMHPDCPASTPSGKEYERWEEIFIAEADAMGKSPRQLDYEIWKAGNIGGIE